MNLIKGVAIYVFRIDHTLSEHFSSRVNPGTIFDPKIP